MWFLSWPDIAHAADLLRFFFQKARKKHWKASKVCLRYHKWTKLEKLIFRKTENLEFTGFSDSYWAGSIDNRKSANGFCFKLSCSDSKLQRCVSTTTAEAELNAVVETSKGAIEFADLYRKLVSKIQQSVIVFLDNQAFISLRNNTINHGRTS